jgi:hypothetical protein
MQEQLYFSFFNQTLTKIKDEIFIEKCNQISEEYYFNKSDKEIEKLVENYEKMGFLLLQKWSMDFYSPERILLPSKKILNTSELFAKRNLVNLSREDQDEIFNAIKYYRLADSEQYQNRYWTYPSFLNQKDQEMQKQKDKARKNN